MSEAMRVRGENALGKAASAYLRTARFQPVMWREWGAEAFEEARRENKPVLLDIGAVWCHWCHVMDRESYENEDTAALINENFVAVKVDRDERPDVDARYQSAVAAISGQGGWPLTAFLTPEGEPFFGGTYFPPDDRYGRPGFRRVLGMMADAFEDRNEEVKETAASVMAALDHNESFSARAEIAGGELVEKLVRAALGQFDARNGGFGSQPKFPHAAAIDLLMDAAGREGENAAQAKAAVVTTLRRMAAGGIHDQLAGGFHRYSVDEQWRVPHFEKMAYDNSELLKNYVHAATAWGDAEFADVARGIMRWMDQVLSDRERGGFYASQDADDSLDDDGDYFTWTREEAAAALGEEEFTVAAAFFEIRPVGDMHHEPAKNVLHYAPGTRSDAVQAVARALRREEGEVAEVLARTAAKIYQARLKRKTPYVDKTVYAGWNGMCVSAYLAAARGLGSQEAREFALRSLDRVLGEAWSEREGLAHVVAYGEGVSPEVRVAGVLEDYAFVAGAALDAWEATGEKRYFDVSRNIAEAMVERFYDRAGGGFFDAEMNEGAIGALKTRRKPLQDAPTPAGNAVAAMVLLRLGALVDDGGGEYERLARETLETFGGMVEHFGMYASSYGLALRRMVKGPLQVCVMGEGAVADELERAAMAGFAANKSVVRVRSMGDLPEVLAGTLPYVPDVGEGVALVCRGMKCEAPVRSVRALVAALR